MVPALTLVAFSVMVLACRGEDHQATPTATPFPTILVMKGALSFHVPADWGYRDADGHDFSILTLSSGGSVKALGLLVVSPAAQAAPTYGNERREAVSIGGVPGLVLKGIVPARLDLNDYLGFW